MLTWTESMSRRDQEKGVSKKKKKKQFLLGDPQPFYFEGADVWKMLMVISRADEKSNVNRKWEGRRRGNKQALVFFLAFLDEAAAFQVQRGKFSGKAVCQIKSHVRYIYGEVTS